jgi:hypothetical protein
MRQHTINLKQTLLVAFLYGVGTMIITAALWPSVGIVFCALDMSSGFSLPAKSLTVALALAASFFVFGLSLVFIVGFISMMLGIRLQEGTHKLGSKESIKWFFVNSLFWGVRALFMDFILLTPLAPTFCRMMGAKIGQGVQINSNRVADLSLIEIGDGSVVGGNATVIGHIFEPDGLKLAKVKIGKGVVIGLNSIVMPGVTIGDGAVVAAGAIVPKGTVIEPRHIYYGPNK